ncbi:MAG: peptidoglycan-binding protein [Actinobacteria bacterium]|nr:peptidoglycan-binding protein [Actinomycetota bacterium]
MRAAEEHGAVGVSWWSWQHADQQAWDAIRDAPQFTLPAAEPAALRPGQVRAYQTFLTTLGFPAPVTGVWDEATAGAVRAYQKAARLPETGRVDAATRAVLFSPFGPPIQPQP